MGSMRRTDEEVEEMKVLIMDFISGLPPGLYRTKQLSKKATEKFGRNISSSDISHYIKYADNVRLYSKNNHNSIYEINECME